SSPKGSSLEALKRGWEEDKRPSRESMRLQEFPGTSDLAFASGIIKTLTFRSNLSPNDDHHPRTSIVKTRRRRAKCGLIPAVWDLDAILLRLPPTLSLLPPANPLQGVKRV
ncbi:MAG: hypothetical protein KA801_19415, partial [Syntrophorhabdaceae bacterium]|nr:hypothetical protein [Syntrophorhabdaceae bacterium]